MEVSMKEEVKASSLPTDVMIEVLSWLPAKSIARLRWVCRQWRSLTHDSSFIKSQHQRASNRPAFLTGHLAGDVMRRYERDGNGQLQLRLEGPHEWRICAPSNSVDGLVCACAVRDHALLRRYGHPASHLAMQQSRYILTNPITGELRRLPDNDKARGEMDYEALSLGFDASAGRYKVVSLARLQGTATGTFENDCAVLTLSTDAEWRHVGKVKFPMSWKTVPVFHHGAIHWGSPHPNPPLILTFDVEAEEFGPPFPVPGSPSSSPAYYQLEYYQLLVLKDHEDSLAVVRYCSDWSLDVWKLTDYTNRVWTKVWRIDAYAISLQIMMACYVIYIVDGKILLHRNCAKYGMAIYCYDVQSKNLCTLSSMDKCDRDEMMHSHVESLISPFSLQASSK